MCLLSKTETACDDGPSSDPPKVLKIFNRSLLYDCVSRADANALEGLLEYLTSHEKRLTDEEFRGETEMCWMSLTSHTCVLPIGLCNPTTEKSDYKETKWVYVRDADGKEFLLLNLNFALKWKLSFNNIP